MSITPEEAARRYERLMPALATWAKSVLSRYAVRVGAEATSPPLMRDAKGEPARRSPTDTGPLRIVSTRLAASLVNQRYKGRQEAINEIDVRLSVGGITVRLFKGSKVPYARRHEDDPRFTYLARAVKRTFPTVRAVAERELAQTINSVL